MARFSVVFNIMPFSEEEKLAIAEHRFFHQSMLEYLQKKEAGQPCLPPLKPRHSIAFLEGRDDSNAGKHSFTLEEMNDYLKSKVVTQEDRNATDVTDADLRHFDTLIDIDQMQPSLKEMAKVLKKEEERTGSLPFVKPIQLKYTLADACLLTGEAGVTHE